MVQLPRYGAFKSKFNGGYLRYVKEDPYVQKCLLSTQENVVSPYTKFELEIAKCDPSLVNIRCCYNNKYWVIESSKPSGCSVPIVAKAEQAEEDKSKWTCTLFKPIYDNAEQAFRFRHVYLGSNLCLTKILTPASTYCLYADPSGPSQERGDLSTIIDCETLLTLPKHIVFRDDNGRYLRAVQIIYNCYDLRFDTMTTTDPGDPHVQMETSTTKDGSIRVRSSCCGKFWRKAYKDRILAHSTDVTDTDPNTLFWPTKIDTNIIALRNLGNNNFVKRVNFDDVLHKLYASVETIDQFSKFRIEEAAVSREIYNVRFRPSDARIYDQSVMEMATGSAINQTKQPNTLSFCLKYTETKTRTWNSSVSMKLGVKTTIESGVPFVADGKIEISAEFSGAYNWGETKTESQEVETFCNVIVPPMTSVVVSLLATKGTYDVPYSYTQHDVLINGDTVISQLDDGVYRGMNSYNFTYQTKKIPMSQ